MPSTIYFTALIAATGKQHHIAVPDNYSMRDLRGMLSATTKIAFKDLQLSRNSRLLPNRPRETVASAGIRGGSQILVSGTEDAISQTLTSKTND